MLSPLGDLVSQEEVGKELFQTVIGPSSVMWCVIPIGPRETLRAVPGYCECPGG